MSAVSLDEVLCLIRDDIHKLHAIEPEALGLARPPNVFGVYMLFVGGEVMYVGRAKGSEGLRDRLRKHISGDEGHAIQRAYQVEFPDRKERRAHIKTNVFVRWLAIEEPRRVSAVERALIWLHNPPWNKD